MQIFNSRELSLILWLSAFFIFSFTKREIRESVIALIKATFAYQLVILYAVMISYTAAIVFVLWQFNLWTSLLLKDTIVWYVITGSSMALKFSSARTHENLFKKTVLDNLKILIIFEFIVNTYTFSFWIELFLVPILIFTAMVNAQKAPDEKHRIAIKAVNRISTFFGFAILFHVIINLLINFNTFFSLETMRKFLLPIFLTFSFFPLTYILSLRMGYDKLFRRINYSIKEDKKLRRYTKFKLASYCRISLKKLDLTSNMSIFNLMQIKNCQDVKNMTDTYKNHH